MDMSAASPTQLTFWVQSPAALSFDVFVNESYTAGADGDQWGTSSPVTVVGDNAWHKVSIPLSSMVGGTTFDTQSIEFVWFGFTTGAYVDPAINFYVDDIAFEP
jgi:hypothetical protein